MTGNSIRYDYIKQISLVWPMFLLHQDNVEDIRGGCLIVRQIILEAALPKTRTNTHLISAR